MQKGLSTLTLYQPWVSLIVHGQKTYDTSRLPAPPALIGRRLFLHATRQEFTNINDDVWERMAHALRQRGEAIDHLPRGTIVGSAQLTGCYQIAKLAGGRLTLADDRVEGSNAGLRAVNVSQREVAFGCFRPGRWIWHFTDPRPTTGWKDGAVKWFNAAKGFGFILPDDGGEDVFMHEKALGGALIKSCPQEGMRVRYRADHTRKGWLAVEVAPACEPRSDPRPVHPSEFRRLTNGAAGTALKATAIDADEIPF